VTTPRLEVHVPISPTPVFLNRVHYLAASVATYGGALADSPVVVTVGADQPPEDLAARLPWTRHYPIEWRWVDREDFRRYSYFATRVQRFTHRFRAGSVLMLDADVVMTGSLADLVEAVEATRSFHGSPAHLSPVRGGFTWEKLFAAAGLGAVPYACEHTGFGLMFHEPENRRCPPYFNLGVLAAPADVMARIGDGIFDELRVVAELESTFRAQMSVCLALVRGKLPWRVLPLRYNFPNDQCFVAAYRAEFEDVRLLHFLRTDELDRDTDFQSPAHVEELFRRRGPALSEVNRRFLERLRSVHDRVLRDG
jgi:hypothetical protein